MKNIVFSLPVMAVTNMEESKKFYQQLLGAEVLHDFGINVSFKEGFALQQEFDWLCGLDKSTIHYQSHNAELCFEAFDFEGFLKTLYAYPGIALVHDVRQYDWQQRVIRFYDPDKHIVEVGEAMITVAKNLLAQGLSEEETATLTQHPIAFIQKAKNFEVKKND